MGRYDRSIKIALDKVSGEILDADEIFNVKTDGFEIRRQYHEKNLLLSCCECEQDLIVSASKYDNLHFKHRPGSDYCVLADGRLTPHEQDRFTAILKSKESERHKELKNKIGMLLKTVAGVDISSIAVDNKCIIKENGRRRPDVYCTYLDKELVFEIQLSDLSLGYILNRYEFYKEHGIYLIWILDNFDIHNQGTLERDIKYLTKYHNFFKLDEQSNTLKLLCEYKFPFLTDNNRYLTKWKKKSVELKELKFDCIEVQAYYSNYSDNCKSVEKLQKKNAKAIEEAERKILEQTELDKANSKAKNIVNSIKRLRDKGAQYYGSICTELENLNLVELKALNESLKLKGRVVGNKPPLIKWIDEAKKDDAAFLQFILKARQIELDKNVTDNSGRSPVQAIINNPNLDNSLILRSLFGAGIIYLKMTSNFLQK